MNKLTILSLIVILTIISTTLWAANTSTFKFLEDIETYVGSQSQSVTAHEIAAYFSPISKASVTATTATNSTTFGTANQYEANSINGEQYTQVVALSSTMFVVAYVDRGNSWHGEARIGTVSGTTITYSTSDYTFNSATTARLGLTALSSSVFVVAFEDDGNSSYGTARLGTVSGTGASASITFSSSTFVFNAGTTDYTTLTSLSSSAFVVAFRDNGNNSHGTALVGTVSGTGASASITFSSSEFVFNAASTLVPTLTSLNSTVFIIAYDDAGNSRYGTARLGTVSGTGASTSITFSSEFVFHAASMSKPSVTSLSSTVFVVTYEDEANSSHGTAMVGTVNGIGASASITFSSSNFVFNAASTFLNHRTTTAMSSSQFVVVFDDEGDSDKGKVVVGTVSGTGASASIAFGTEEEFATRTFYPTITVLRNNLIGPPSISNTNYVIGYDDRNAGISGYAVVGDASSALPVELNNFNGEMTSKGIQLSWQTASEQNNEGFDIQRSTDGSTWETIGFVTGNGTTTEVSNYKFVDQPNLRGLSFYYRLKQIDFDGKFEYSDIVNIQLETGNEQLAMVKVFPNPASDAFNIESETAIGSIIQVFNLQGQLVLERQHQSIISQIPTDDLDNGTYFIKMNNQVRKVIVQK